MLALIDRFPLKVSYLWLDQNNTEAKSSSQAKRDRRRLSWQKERRGYRDRGPGEGWELMRFRGEKSMTGQREREKKCVCVCVRRRMSWALEIERGICGKKKGHKVGQGNEGRDIGRARWVTASLSLKLSTEKHSSVTVTRFCLTGEKRKLMYRKKTK